MEFHTVKTICRNNLSESDKEQERKMYKTNNTPKPSGTSPHNPSGSGGVRVPETGRGPRKPRK